MLYAILDISLLYQVSYKNYHLENWQVLQDSYNTVRKNNDESQFIISFKEDNPPAIVDGKTTYTQKELLNIVNDPSNGWIPDED